MMFGNALHLLKPKVHFASDCHTLENDTVRFKCATLNALGMERETVVLLDCEKGTIALGDEADSVNVKGEKKLLDKRTNELEVLPFWVTTRPHEWNCITAARRRCTQNAPSQLVLSSENTF